jgi:prolyl 4-hydroxylase
MAPKVEPRPLHPRQVLVIDSFVSEGVCRQILEDLECSYWHSSSVLQHRSGRYYSEVREHFRASVTAEQCWFGPKLNRIIGRIEKRLAILLPCDPVRLEEWQATRYGKGGRFHYHIDGGYWRRSRAGDRKRTYMIYLDTPQKGGETHFRALDITVAPKPGRLVVWENLLPSGQCDHAMIHGGLEVRKGTKTTLVTWERERSLRKEDV